MDDPAYLPAVAALAGSAVGGLTSFASAWLTQRHQDRAKRLLQDKAHRQLLYEQFIDEASKLYADALTHDKSDISALVSVYALIGQMRIQSSLAMVEKAEVVVRTIIDTYFAPNRTFPEFRELVNSHTIDLLRDFTDECRTELQALRDSQLALDTVPQAGHRQRPEEGRAACLGPTAKLFVLDEDTLSTLRRAAPPQVSGAGPG